MIKSAITVSLVPEAKGGPFVFWDGLADCFKNAQELGFDAVEIFAPGPDAVDRTELAGLVEKHKLAVAAVGTGAGMVKHGLSLSDSSADKRQQAVAFVKQMIDFGAEFSAPAIIGSMQGRWGGETDKPTAVGYLAAALNELGEYAATKNVPLIYEPLNRYETNLLNTLSDAAACLDSIDSKNVKLLADLFHMNIEESDVAKSLKDNASHIGHIHYVDSNRQAAGFGHTDFDAVASSLLATNFSGYISAEVCPIPDSMTTAKQTIKMFNQHFKNAGSAV